MLSLVSGYTETYSDNSNLAVHNPFITIRSSTTIPTNEGEKRDMRGIRNDLSKAWDSIEAEAIEVADKWDWHLVVLLPWKACGKKSSERMEMLLLAQRYF